MSILNRKITIYEGTIKKLYVENVTLNRNEVTPIVKNEIVKEDALFRKSIFDFISLEHNTSLPTEEEATDYLNRVMNSRKKIAHSILVNDCIPQEEKEEFLNHLSQDSSCIYLAEETIKPIKEVSRKEYKQFIKK